MNNNTKLLGRTIYWLVLPLLFIYLRNSRRSRIIVSKANEILLIKNWIGSGLYTLPGGGIKKNEKPENGIIRELREETGICLDLKQLRVLKPVHLVTDRGHKYHCYGFYANVEVDTKYSRHRLEIAEILWAKPKDVLGKYQLTSTSRALITTWLGNNHLID